MDCQLWLIHGKNGFNVQSIYLKILGPHEAPRAPPPPTPRHKNERNEKWNCHPPHTERQNKIIPAARIPFLAFANLVNSMHPFCAIMTCEVHHLPSSPTVQARPFPLPSSYAQDPSSPSFYRFATWIICASSSLSLPIPNPFFPEIHLQLLHQPVVYRALPHCIFFWFPSRTFSFFSLFFFFLHLH